MCNHCSSNANRTDTNENDQRKRTTFFSSNESPELPCRHLHLHTPLHLRLRLRLRLPLHPSLRLARHLHLRLPVPLPLPPSLHLHLLLLHHRLPRRLLLVAPPLAPSPPPLLNRRPPHLRLLRLDLPPCHRLDRHPLRSSPLRHLLLLLLELVVSHYCAGSIDTFVIVIDIGGERDAPHLLLLHHRLPRRLLLVAPPLAPSPPPLLNRRPPHLRLLRLDLPPCHRLDRHPLRSSPLRHLLLLLLELVVSHYCAGSIDTYGEVRRGGPTEERPLLGGRA
mmetsp:Transcript_22467/g.55419  ORF Transcript_22467/g.55419 Transcript_22467/m.55419 type:complete len:278 (+) Transcript_22467:1231-2064(+)